MKFLFRGLLAALAAFGGAAHAHDVVSGGADGLPLGPSPVSGSGYVPLDVSTDGRYVLFSNYDPNTTSYLSIDATECRIYRKDRDTGALLIVFDSSDIDRTYCNGAKMSADGNIVVTSPAAPPSDPDGTIIVVDGITQASFGDVIVVSVKDISANSVTEILTPFTTTGANDIARIQIGSSGVFTEFGGYTIEQLSADGSTALSNTLQVVGDTVSTVPFLIDIATESVETDLLSLIDDSLIGDAEPLITGTAVNGDGRYLAFSVALLTTVPNPDPQPPFWFGPWETVETEFALYRLDRSDGSVLRSILPDTFGPDGDEFITLQPGSLSFSGNTVTWYATATVCPPTYGLDANSGGFVPAPCDEALPDYACGTPECESTIYRYSFLSETLQSQRTAVRQGTVPGASNQVSFSTTTEWLLYPRKVVQPFDDDYLIPEPPAWPSDFTCINRDSIDSGSGIAVEETCVETNPGPIRGPNSGPILPGGLSYTELNPPQLWILRNLVSGSETPVSVHNNNGFQSTTAVMSSDAATIVFSSRDPRLREDDLTGINLLDESLLDPACFWPNGPDGTSLRVTTNDNTRFFTAPTQYIYETMPVLCPAPTPALDANLFASDVLVRVSDLAEAVEPERSSGGSSFGPFLLLLLGWYGVASYLRRTGQT